MKLIEIKGVKKQYGQQQVLAGVNLELEENKQYVLQGSSGSGKSTLLHILGGLENADAGDVRVGNFYLSDLSDEELADYRNSVLGVVFQFHFLLPSLSCRDNLLLPARLGKKLSSAVEDRINYMADRLGIADLLDKYPSQLSGGEQQRVNITRALSLRPKILLCDEPTGNLDSENSQKVIALIREMANEFEAALLLVTHDSQVASEFPHTFEMKDGLVQLSSL